MNTKAIAILRVSSLRQKDGISHETQEKEIREYAKEHGYDIKQVAAIIESAKDHESREKFNAWIKWALTNGVRHIIWYMADREVRNFTDLERMEKLIRQDSIEVHYVRERKHLHSKSPDSDFSMREIEAWRDKQLSRTIATKMSDAMLTKAQSGWYPGNWPPLGYKHQKLKGDDGKELKRGSVIVIDSNEKAVKQVTREFELRAEGLSFQEIRNKIVSEGFISPERIPNYHKSEVEKRLKNPFYAGKFRWGGELFDGKHPLIIPREIVLKVQGGVTHRKTTRQLNEFNLFGYEWMKCAECGCHYVYESKKLGKFHLYRCSNTRGHHETLKGLYMPLSAVWSGLEASIERIAIPASFAKEIARALNETHSKSHDEIKQRLKHLNEMIAATEAREIEAYDRYDAGKIDELSYQRLIKRFRSESDKYRAEISAIESTSKSDFRENANTILELSECAKELWKSRNAFERKEFAEMLHSNRLVCGTSLQFTLKKALDLVAKMKEKDSWRLHLDDLRTALLVSPLSKTTEINAQDQGVT